MMHGVTVAGVILVAAVTAVATGQEVPFPQALEHSSIALTSLDEPINDALILGNGDLNGLLFAEGEDLVFRLTKNDVWDARLDAPLDPPLPTLKRLKELGKGDWPDRNWILPEGSEWKGPDSYHAHAYPCPRACGVIRISGAAAGPLVAKLDIRRASAEVHADNSSTRCFVPDAANIVVFETDAPPVLEAIVSDDLPAPSTGDAGGVAWVMQEIPGDLDWPGMWFAVACAAENGRCVVSVVSSLESDTPREAACALAKEMLARDIQEMRTAHEAAWGAFWARSGIELAEATLQRVWYRNLYFLRCVSKPGVVSPGLFAGLLDDKPAWHGDYHTNYNIQQTFWAAYAANHCDLAEPYDSLMAGYLPRARWLARQVFEMDGAYIPHVLFAYEPADPAACANPNGRQYIHHVWGFTLGVAGFSFQPLWWRYKYQPDREYLEEIAYPAIRDVAVFYAEFVEQCERDGDHIVLAPTVSPEHHGWTEGFKYNRDCAFCIAYFRYIFDAACEGAETLGVDKDLIGRWTKARALLPDYPLAPTEDVVVDVAGASPITYNIPVPTTPVFPADVVGWFSAPEEQQLFIRTLEQLRHNGNNAPVMLAVTRARLGMPDARDWLHTELERRERRNGTLSFNRIETLHRFNDFGHYTEMFGAALPVTELLLQSVGDVIRVFPAWPGNLPARFERLRAQGGFLVSATMAGGKAQSVTIESTVGGELALMAPWENVEMRVDNGDWQKAEADADGILRIATQPGERIEFRPGT